jgi:uncharacterized protein YuzE
MRNGRSTNFELSVSGRDDGTLEAAYIQILDAPVHCTREIEEDVLLADYAVDGRLVGVEILAPVRLADLEHLIEEGDMRTNFGRFLSRSVPHELVTA